MNSSNQSVTLEEFNDYIIQLLIPNSIILVIYFIASVIGNGMVLIVYKFKLRSKIMHKRFFIPILAVLDMAACIVGSSFALSINFNFYTFRIDAMCRLTWTLNKFTSLSSGLMLLVIAVQRFRKVCRPFGWQLNRTRCIYAVSCIVVLSIVLASPCLYLIGVDQHITKYRNSNITVFVCGIDSNVDRKYDTVYSMVLLIICFVGIIALSLLYGFILKTIYKQEAIWKKKPTYGMKAASVVSQVTKIVTVTDESETCNDIKLETTTTRLPKSAIAIGGDHQISAFRTSDSPNSSLKNIVQQILRKHKTSIMFLSITVLFAVSHLPRIVLMILESKNEKFWDQLSGPQLRFCLFLYRVYLVNNILNPAIYSVFDKSFRKECKSLCNG